MNGILMRLTLFVVSYVPLLAILAVKAIPSGPTMKQVEAWIPTAIWALVTIVSIILTRYLLRAPRKVTTRPITIESASEEGGNAAAYLATYLLPFLFVDGTGWRVWVPSALFLVTLVVVAVNSDLILINPTMYLLGRRVYRVHLQRATFPGAITARGVIVISTQTLHPGDSIEAVPWAGGEIEVRKRPEKGPKYGEPDGSASAQ